MHTYTRCVKGNLPQPEEPRQLHNVTPNKMERRGLKNTSLMLYNSFGGKYAVLQLLKKTINGIIKGWREGSPTEKVMIGVAVGSMLIGIGALVISLSIYNYTKSHDKITDNITSYLTALEYKIVWDEADTDYSPTILDSSPESISITNKKAIIEAIAGGIYKIDLIYFYEGEILRVLSVKAENNDRTVADASDMAVWMKEFTQYAYAVGPSSQYIQNGTGTSYYTNIYVLVEGHQREYSLELAVFEYEVDNNGVLTGRYNIREYHPIDILFSGVEEDSYIPSFDLKIINDYKLLNEEIKSIYQ